MGNFPDCTSSERWSHCCAVHERAGGMPWSRHSWQGELHYKAHSEQQWPFWEWGQFHLLTVQSSAGRSTPQRHDLSYGITFCTYSNMPACPEHRRSMRQIGCYNCLLCLINFRCFRSFLVPLQPELGFGSQQYVRMDRQSSPKCLTLSRTSMDRIVGAANVWMVQWSQDLISAYFCCSWCGSFDSLKSDLPPATWAFCSRVWIARDEN